MKKPRKSSSGFVLIRDWNGRGDFEKNDGGKSVFSIPCFYVLTFTILGILLSVLSFLALERTKQTEYVELKRKLEKVMDEKVTPFIKDKVIDKLDKMIEESVDPLVSSVREKFIEYKMVISSIVADDNSDWIENKTFFEELNIQKHYPVVIVPGTITTELEVWKGKECMTNKFRTKIWGELGMLSKVLLTPSCWLEHMKLNMSTGLDPEGIKVRPAIDSIDYLFPSFWVWGRVIQALGNIGYDLNSMMFAEYDWRLKFSHMEIRDKYFTRLQANIKLLSRTNGNKKCVVVVHSMGGNVMYYFLNWVKSKSGGNDPSFADKYIHDWVIISAPLLGAVKSIPSILSGEMKDTADVFFFDSLLEKFMSKKQRAEAFRSWGFVLDMLPRGSHELWGDLLRIEDENGSVTNVTIDGLLSFLKKATDPVMAKHLDQIFLGVPDEMEFGKDREMFWGNPFANELPAAPNMAITCFYGLGIDTEYNYKIAKVKNSTQETFVKYILNFDNKSPIIVGDGDGTCNDVSLRHPCRNLWKQKKYNPALMDIKVKEYVHSDDYVGSDLRGGGKSANHVNIMGNREMIVDLLKICGNQKHKIERYVDEGIETD